MKSVSLPSLLVLLLTCSPLDRAESQESPIEISGIYPSLRMWNEENECGTGAVVVWQGDLWAITYAPHRPEGSTDKLYRFTPALEKIIFEGSVGGTPANRMIHRESNQLLIGPYLIDGEKNIRVIPPSKMFGRLTGNARHLTTPGTSVYYATMEEGLYEVDVNTLDVTCLIRDNHGQAPPEGVPSTLPGYHGKGLYTGHGRVIYSNNGDRDPRNRVDPTIPSGALAEWHGESGSEWQLVRRNQFTEVTGPGGIEGNIDPGKDPVWAMGWDARSLLLALLENGDWHYYRLPKGSHSYDGSHGWNTEWPRIREIGGDQENDLLATMHGTFWRFPRTFSRANSAGISPRSNYLKVIGDFCRWGDRIVFGCDDSAKSEFLNSRPFKAEHAAPGQSNSNLWFVEPDQLDHFGPAIGRGSVWLRDTVEADTPSDPYLFEGYDFRQLYLVHGNENAVAFQLEIDRQGTNQWEPLREITVPAGEAISEIFPGEERGAWIRLRARSDVTGMTANFQYRNQDPRPAENDPLFAGIATPDHAAASVGVMRSLSHDHLAVVSASDPGSEELHVHGILEDLTFTPSDDTEALHQLVKEVRQPLGSVRVDAASVLVVENGKRYRLPRSPEYSAEYDEPFSDEDEGAATSRQGLADLLGENLLAGAEVKTSSVHADYHSRNAIDGNLSDDASRWISTNADAQWIEFDLGSEQELASLWVVSGWKKESAYLAKNFDVQIPDGNEWKTVAGGEVRNNDALETEVRFPSPVTTRRIRLASQDAGFFRLYEVAAFDRLLDISPPDPVGLGPARICREVATERDLLNLHGTFYELPARNAQGLAKVRPIATHNLAIQDFCSHNGLLFFTGVDAESRNDRIFRSDDGKTAVWVGAVDDLWELGKPRGIGGPWKDSTVKSGVPSDPYLMTAYDRKTVTLSASSDVDLSLEVDIDGTGVWIPYRTFKVSAEESIEHVFPDGFSAYWVRAISNQDTQATVQLRYD